MLWVSHSERSQLSMYGCLCNELGQQSIWKKRLESFVLRFLLFACMAVSHFVCCNMLGGLMCEIGCYRTWTPTCTRHFKMRPFASSLAWSYSATSAGCDPCLRSCQCIDVPTVTCFLAHRLPPRLLVRLCVCHGERMLQQV